LRWGETESLGTAAANRLLYNPQMADKRMEHSMNDSWQEENRRIPRTHPNATLYVEKPTWRLQK
jgi:hypothetical protein